MMDSIRTWLVSVVVASILISVAQTLIPPGAIRKISSMTGGLILLLTILQPILRSDLGKLELNYETYAKAIEQRQSELEITEKEELSELIAEKTQAYISDKATQLGLSCEAEVTTTVAEDGIPYPSGAQLSGPRSAELENYLEEELGIPKERQVWNGTE